MNREGKNERTKERHKCTHKQTDEKMYNGTHACTLWGHGRELVIERKDERVRKWTNEQANRANKSSKEKSKWWDGQRRSLTNHSSKQMHVAGTDRGIALMIFHERVVIGFSSDKLDWMTKWREILKPITTRNAEQRKCEFLSREARFTNRHYSILVI